MGWGRNWGVGVGPEQADAISVYNYVTGFKASYRTCFHLQPYQN